MTSDEEPSKKTRQSLDQLLTSKLAENGWFFTEVAISSVLMTFLGLTSAIYVMQVYDRVIPVSATSSLIVLTIGVLIALALEFAARHIRSKQTERFSEVTSLDLQDSLFNRSINDMEGLKGSVGTLYSHLKQVDVLINYRISAKLFLLVDIPLTFILLIFVWFVGGVIMFVPFTLLIIVTTISWILAQLLDRETEISTSYGNRKNAIAIEALLRIENIQALNAQWRYKKTWEEYSVIAGGSDLKLKWISALATNSSHFFQQISYVLLVCVGSLLIIDNQLTVGSLIACTIVGSRALGPISQLPQLLLKRKKYLIAHQSLTSLFEATNNAQIRDRIIHLPDIEGNYDLKNIGHNYASNGSSNLDFVIEHLSFEASESIGIVGHIGSGKSTLLRFLSGLTSPNEGSVLLDGVPVNEIDEGCLRSAIGYLPQENSLVSGNLYENLTLGLRSVDDPQLVELCKQVGLTRLISDDRGGFSQTIAEDGSGLSGGEKRLVGLVRALISDPSVLLLDEPTDGLDKDTEQLVLARLFGTEVPIKTIILVSHKASVLKKVDKILVLNAGRVAAYGPREDIMNLLTQRSPLRI